MDLDEVKKAWQETNIETNLDDNKVQKILDNTRGKTALDKLIGYEKLGRILFFGCMLLSPLFLRYGVFIFALYWALLLPGIVWQFYKVKYLNKIDVATMNILSISSAINTYKKYLTYEFWIGAIWAIFFLVAFVMNAENMLTQDLLKGNTAAIIFFTVLIIATITIMLLMYYFMYWKHIKKIQKSIAEVRYFKEGND